ncbi:hypothetical protein Pla175_06570 [Pirellulimonas nuda]|uniref:Tetratricopeptide repeat protein n=1 Tax=Pirellulimonas nuda TaxID=2528009 RepID=A0A518D737_9BACT|nr:hypothetical protein [Pirellulimonas nuda]QDU87298.1 hypothetical protein Pla175_06570 [Pirellulimonas nuda]
MARTLALFLLLVAPAAAADDAAQKLALARSLREQGQFDYAIKLASERIERSDLPEAVRVEFAIEYARASVGKALGTPRAQRRRIATQCNRTLEKLQGELRQTASRRVIELQACLSLAAMVRTDLAEADDADRRVLRDLDDRLERMVEEIETGLARASDRQNESLANHARVEHAGVLQMLAETYPPESADRDDAALRALGVAEPLAHGRVPDALRWRARGVEVACLALLGRDRLHRARLAEYKADAPADWLAAADTHAKTARAADEPGRRGAELYAAGKLDEAVDAYDRAAADAFRSGAHGSAFECSLAAAAIRHQQGKLSDAARRFRRAALAASDRPEAPAAHHAGLLAAAEAARRDPALKERYAEMLREHAATWPRAETAEKARWWLTKLLAADEQWDAILSETSGLTQSDPRYAEGMSLRIEASARKHAALSGAAADAWLAEATAELQPLVTGRDNRWPDAWTPIARHAALALARMHADDPESDYSPRLLAKALAGAPEPDPQWRRDAATLLAQLLIERGDLDGAAPWLAAADTGPVLEALAEKLRSADPHGREAAAKLIVQVTTDAKGKAAELRAEALVSLGFVAEATELLAGQAEGGPAARLRLAQLLTRHPDASQRQRAVKLLHALEKEVPAGDALWGAARCARIRALLAAGRKEEAGKLFQITATLEPTVASGAAFQEVAREIAEEPGARKNE